MSDYLGLWCVLGFLGLTFGGLLGYVGISYYQERKDMKACPEHLKRIPNYKTLSFTNFGYFDRHFKDSYGSTIEVKGFGVDGLTIKTASVDNVRCSWGWFIKRCPDYAHEVLMLADPEYKAKWEAEQELEKMTKANLK
jgi:hypothetical protein